MCKETKELLKLYQSASSEDKEIIYKFVCLFAEDPKRFEFAVNWKGTAADLKAEMVRICRKYTEVPAV